MAPIFFLILVFALGKRFSEPPARFAPVLPVSAHLSRLPLFLYLNSPHQEPAPINKAGLRIDYGTSYVQTVTFDARGPVAQAILTYGQSTNPASPHANDQMREFSAKRWHTLPFHRDDVVKARVGEPLRLVRP